MISILRDTIYFNVENKIDEYTDLINTNKYIAVYVGDFNRGFQFQQRLMLDCYILLTTPEKDLIIDSYQSLDRPINAYFHALLVMEYEITKYKRMNSSHLKLSLLVSVFLVKKIVSNLLPNVSKFHANLIDLQSLSNLELQEDAKVVEKINTQIIKELKQQEISTLLGPLLIEAIQDAKTITNIMELNA